MTSTPDQRPHVQKPGSGTSHRAITFRTVLALMLREMSTRYGRSPGGYVWAVLEPLGAIVILSIGFSILLRAPSLGTSFLLFYATGYLPFNVYQTISLTVARAISFSKPLLMYPVVRWMDAVLARFLLNGLTALLVGYILITAIVFVTGSRVVLDVGPIVESTVLAGLLGFGIGCFNCALTGIYPTWEIIWSILTRPLFIISGVLYIYEDMPRFAQDVLWFNPLMHITGLMRMGFYPTYSPNYISIVYTLVWAVVPLLFGLILLTRYHRDILNQ